jgi:hypothetical protein
MRHLPVIYGGHDVGPRPVTRERVWLALERGAEPVAVVAQVGRGLSDLWDQCLTKLGGRAGEPACVRGCVHCCHQRVEVTALEVFLVARLLTNALPEQLERLTASATRHAGMSSREHFQRQLPCPFLGADKACEVYDARPLACRRAHSLDAEVCLRLAKDEGTQGGPPLLEPLDWNLSALTLGYYEALVHANVPPHLYELAGGVHLALSIPDAEARWFAGEDVLRPALLRDADALLRVLGCGDGNYAATAPNDELTDGT